MCNLLRVQWTLVPRHAPLPWIACGGCGIPRPFQSSGKVRLNANGKTLDAWLIYKCTVCAKTWNRPIFERRNVHDIDPATVAALHGNDPRWIRAQAFQIDALRRHTHRIEESDDVLVQRKILTPGAGPWTSGEIKLIVPLPTKLRLDRLLARELGASRSRIQAWLDDGTLQIEPPHQSGFRRSLKHGCCIRIECSTGPAAKMILLRLIADSGP
jgi:hypothetical protein